MLFKNLINNTFVVAIDGLEQDYLRDKNYRIARDSDFKELEHPRDADGKFASSGNTKNQEGTLERMKKEVPESVENEIFGETGYIYYTPHRPIENSQEKMLGTKIKPLHERVFVSDKPLSSDKLNDIEAIPISQESKHQFAKELADSGVVGMMNKDGKRFSFVHESTKHDGKIQITYYDKSGAILDSQHNDRASAIEELIEGGFMKILPEEKVGSLIQKVMVG